MLVDNHGFSVHMTTCAQSLQRSSHVSHRFPTNHFLRITYVQNLVDVMLNFDPISVELHEAVDNVSAYTLHVKQFDVKRTSGTSLSNILKVKVRVMEMNIL